MDGKRDYFKIGLLVTCALLVVAALMASRNGRYVAVTKESSSGRESLYVMDTATGALYSQSASEEELVKRHWIRGVIWFP